MFKRLVSWFILVPLSLLLVVFALANRQVVTVNFDPFSLPSPLLGSAQVPLFIIIYGALIFGIVLGGIAAWFAQRGQRRQKRLWRRQARTLEKERSDDVRGAGATGKQNTRQNTLVDVS